MEDYENGNYGSALEKLEEASKLSDAPLLLLSRSYVLDKLGKLRDARRLYVAYLKKNPDDPDAKLIQQRVDWIGQELGETPAASSAPPAASSAPPAASSAPPAASAAPKGTSAGGVALAPKQEPLAPVRFQNRGAPVKVTDTGTGKTCTTPCSLELPVGLRHIVLADQQQLYDLHVSAEGGTYSVNDTDPLTFVGGISFGLGASAAIVAGVLYVVDDESDHRRTAKIVALSGGAVAVVGFPIMLASDPGGIRPVDDDTQARRHTARKAAFLPLAAPLPGGGGYMGVAARF